MKFLLTVIAAVVALIAWSLSKPVISLTREEMREKYGPWAVVAGGCTGMGKSWSEEIAKWGIDVIIMSRNITSATTTSKELSAKYNIKSKAIAADLSLDNTDLFKTLTKDNDIGLLVYNAAGVEVGTFAETSLESHNLEVNINVNGVLQATSPFVKKLVGEQRPGGIIIMSSMSCIQGTGYVGNYAATKAWDKIFAHSLWAELSSQNIDVSSCVAGSTTTPNYLKIAHTRNKFIEMPSSEVTSECLAAMVNGMPSTVPGTLNKIVNFLFSSVVPVTTTLKEFTKETRVLFGK